MEYEVVIGLEIHCELKTAAKIFCSCPNVFGTDENTNVCPVCLGMPGTLPVLNEKVVEYAVKAGLALNCEISHYSKFDRKNYFYPDLPKAYQISQFDKPICLNGWLEITDENGNPKKIGITRIHIEEDAGKLIHTNNATLIDYNRSCVPLIEIVTEPDMRSPREAEEFAKKARAILEAAGVSDCRMQEGSLRFDVNLSLREKGAAEYGTRTEMKNLNSFRSLLRAADFETDRQSELLRSGEKVIQETRRWDDSKGISLSMRSKEDAHDYRYFPDPDLVAVVLTDEDIERIRSEIPELPHQKKQRYISEGLSEYDADILTSDIRLCSFFESASEICKDPKTTANFIIGDVSSFLKSSDGEADELKFSAADLAELIIMANNKEVSLSAAKKVLAAMNESGKKPADIISETGLRQVNDADFIREIVLKVLTDNPQSAADIKSGKNKAVGFVVGQVMKISKGAANPAIVNELIAQLLEEI